MGDFSSPFWPSSTLGGNRGREQGGFLLVGLLAGIWREGDRQTHREKESESGYREGEEGSGNWFLGMLSEVWRRKEWRQGWHVFEAGH